MKKIVLSGFILLSVLYTSAQQNGNIKGVVRDSTANYALELATVTIFNKDTVMLNYQLTDKNGAYNIDKLPLHQKLILNITYTGYSAYYSSFILDSVRSLTSNVYLHPSLSDSNAVVVKAVIPIRMNEDTLEINPGAFKLDPNAVTEELLNQVPGFMIWADGSITMNGKKVPKVLVDGKPFMGGADITVATQNLPKSAIDKIQVYQEVDRTKELRTGTPEDSTFTMNIKLKEDKKKGYFGKGGVGYGTDRRYESDLSFQMYDKKNNLGLGAGINNINKSIGDIQAMFKNNSFRNFNPNLFNTGNFGRSGINKSYAAGTTFTHNFNDATNGIQSNRITANYDFSGSNSFIQNLSLQNRTTTNNPQNIETTSETVSNSNNHALGLNYQKNSGFNDDFNVRLNGRTSTNDGTNTQDIIVKNDKGELLSTNLVNTVSKSNSQSVSTNFAYTKNDEESNLKSFRFNLGFNTGKNESERNVFSLFDSYTEPKDDTAYNRLYQSNDNNLALNASLNYSGLKRLLFRRFNFFGIDMSLNQNFNYNNTKRQNNVYDFDSTISQYKNNSTLTNYNNRTVFEYQPSLNLSKGFNKFTQKKFRSLMFMVSSNLQFLNEQNASSIANRNVDRSFQFLRYNGSTNYNYRKNNHYYINSSAGYGIDYSFPSIDQLYPIIDNINLYNLQAGAFNLRNTKSNNLNSGFSFGTQKPTSLTEFGLNVNAGYAWYKNAIVDSVLNDTSGRRVFYLVNVDNKQSFNLGYSTNISRKFKKNILQLMYNGGYGKSKSPNYIDSIYTTSYNTSINHNISLQFSLGTVVILKVSEVLNNNRNKQFGKSTTTFTNNMQSTQLSLTVNYPKNLSIGNTLSYTKNTSAITKPVFLWNAFATYRFLNSQSAELKFSAMDILNQFQNITNTLNYDGATTRITNGLQQYFLLTFSYYPRQFGKREKGGGPRQQNISLPPTRTVIMGSSSF